MNEANMTLGEIAAQGPSTRGVLLRNKLDFCCGGRRTLDAACVKAGLDTAALVLELQDAMQVPSKMRDWSEAPLEEIIEHIIGHYHRRLSAQLNVVVAAAERVERVHGSKLSCPDGLAEHLRGMRAELNNHMAKEEQLLFPAVVIGGRGSMLSGPVRFMMEQHDDHGAILRTNRKLTRDFVGPPDACTTWLTLYEQLAQMEGDLLEHIYLENQILFPRALEGAT